MSKLRHRIWYHLCIGFMLAALILYFILSIINQQILIPLPSLLYKERRISEIKECPTPGIEISVPHQSRNVRVLNPNQTDNKEKIILLWTTFFDKSYSTDFYFLSRGAETFKYYKCPTSNCIATNNRSLIEKADAVLFHQVDFNIKDLPTYRHQNQRWIFYSLETPMNVVKSWKKQRGLFNWTMTYREDSDIRTKYGEVCKLPLAEQTVYETDYLQNKTGEVVWFVSHCRASSNRMGYVRRLLTNINVDIYGKCGNKICAPRQSSKCYENVLKNYKFYLSFENSICKDYVTEKFFNVLNYDIIPVVMGGADYKSIAPPNSYIDTRDYENPNLLAMYLNAVGNDKALYNSYFKWKGKYKSYLYPWMCNLCEKVSQSKKEPPVVLKDVFDWWVRKANCERWRNRKFRHIFRAE